jgi:GGDEF domain-containing protein
MSNRYMTVEERPANTYVRDRSALFSELSEAVRADSADSVLVVIGFEGIALYLETADRLDAEHFLNQVGAALVVTVAGAGTVFRSRRGEFCILCEGGLSTVRPLLVMLPAIVDEITRPFNIRSSLGIAVLPDEATIPTYALALADRRIRALSGEVRAKAA